MFMKFKTPFWSKPSDTNPRPIKYGPYRPNNPQWEDMDTYETEKMGATGITDQHLKQVNSIKIHETSQAKLATAFRSTGVNLGVYDTLRVPGLSN